MHRVVVVTVNFRLGALGFLSTADEFSPGNYGMLDLALALRWVHSTIRSFNGDPQRITLMGLGSGAAAAGLLMVPSCPSFVNFNYILKCYSYLPRRVPTLET